MLGVIRSELISDLRGNTSGRNEKREPIKVDDTRLPRKRKFPTKQTQNTPK